MNPYSLANQSEQLRNTWSSQCVDSPAGRDNLHKKVGVWPCHKQGGNQVSVPYSIDCRQLAVSAAQGFLCPDFSNKSPMPCFVPFQYWLLSETGEIRRDEACLDYAGTDIILYPCHGSKGNQQWFYDHEVGVRM